MDKLIVIGGGPAGVTAALRGRELGAAVLGLAARRALMDLSRALSGAQWRALGRTPTAPAAEWERRDGAA